MIKILYFTPRPEGVLDDSIPQDSRGFRRLDQTMFNGNFVTLQTENNPHSFPD